jgi:hypothetical protein
MASDDGTPPPDDAAVAEVAEHPRLRARVAELEAALARCDVVMDSAGVLGLAQQLPPAYRDSWAAAHAAARAALAGGNA